MKFIKEFKSFISRGNALDLAVAVIIAAAFGAIVNSLVGDLITPLLSLAIGGIDFSHLYVELGAGDNAARFTYGNFLQALISFLIIAFIVFLFVKLAGVVLRLKLQEAPPTKPCPYCAIDIPETAVRCPSCTTVLDKAAIPSNLL